MNARCFSWNNDPSNFLIFAFAILSLMCQATNHRRWLWFDIRGRIPASPGAVSQTLSATAGLTSDRWKLSSEKRGKMDHGTIKDLTYLPRTYLQCTYLPCRNIDSWWIYLSQKCHFSSWCPLNFNMTSLPSNYYSRLLPRVTSKKNVYQLHIHKGTCIALASLILSTFRHTSGSCTAPTASNISEKSACNRVNRPLNPMSSIWPGVSEEPERKRI